MNLRLLTFVPTFFVALSALAPCAQARRNGNVGVDCAACHTGGSPPDISLTVEPTAPIPGSPATLILRVSGTGLQAAGFYLAADEFGDFSSLAGQSTSVKDTGVTHSSPILGSGGTAEVRIGWTPPQAPGGVKFTVAAVNANNDGRSSGDAMSIAQFDVAFGCDGVPIYRDADGDGIGESSFGEKLGCGTGAGWSTENGDCDENDTAVHPGATEICNGKDDDCNGEVDEGTSPREVYPDQDGDGFGRESDVAFACELPAGYVSTPGDCADGDPAVHPGATEVCNGTDDNCDGQVDEGARARCGLGWCERLAVGCSLDSCVPGEPSPETCNGVDDDCDGEVDEGQLCPTGQACISNRCQPGEPDTTTAPVDATSPTDPAPSSTAPSTPSVAPSNPTPSTSGADTPPTSATDGSVEMPSSSQPTASSSSIGITAIVGDDDSADEEPQETTRSTNNSSGCALTPRPARQNGPVTGLLATALLGLARRKRRARP